MKAIGAVALLLGSVALASPALAHDSPHGIQLIFPSPAADAAPIALTNRGLLFPNTASIGSTYSLRCNESYGINSAAVPHAVLDDKGALLVATTIDVRLSQDRGCSWQVSKNLPDESLGGFAQNASMPAELLISTQSYETTSQVFGSSDYGNTWTPKFTNGPLSVYEHLLSSADGKRVLAAGHRFDQPTRKLLALWSMSSDGGATWVDQELTDDRVPLGFHPTDPNILFAREPIPGRTIDPQDRLMRSSDGGKTFELVKELPFLDAFAATPDGSSIWIGSQTDGLQVSKDAGRTFTRVLEDSIISIYCLQYRQGRLWACTRVAPNTGAIHYSDDQGCSFSKLLQFDEVKSPVSCDNDSQMLCAMPWRDWTYELLTNFSDGGVPASSAPAAPISCRPQPPEAGLADAGSSDVGGHVGAQVDAGLGDGHDSVDAGAKAIKRDRGCSAFPVGDDSGAALTPFFALGALALVQRRRRR